MYYTRVHIHFLYVYSTTFTQIVTNCYICPSLLRWRYPGEVRCVRKLLEELPVKEKKKKIRKPVEVGRMPHYDVGLTPAKDRGKERELDELSFRLQ